MTTAIAVESTFAETHKFVNYLSFLIHDGIYDIILTSIHVVLQEELLQTIFTSTEYGCILPQL